MSDPIFLSCPSCSETHVFPIGILRNSSSKLECTHCNEQNIINDWFGYSGKSHDELFNPIGDEAVEKEIPKEQPEEFYREVNASAIENAIPKHEFINRYIVDFMATWDANHLTFYHDEIKITMECEYVHARKAAELAYERYLKGLTDA